MPLATSRSVDSIDFEVEGSTNCHSSDIAFTVEKKRRVSSRPASKPNRKANSKDAVHGAADHPVKSSHTSRPSQAQKATAPDPDETSSASDNPSSHSSSAATSSSSPSRPPSPSSSKSGVSASISLASYSTFPTVTVTTPSLSTSHQHVFPSRQPSPSLVAFSRPRSPRVNAVLERGGPSSRGNHSLSPMAPDAARTPPPEPQGPLRYLREHGLTPSSSAEASVQQQRARNGQRDRSAQRVTPEKQMRSRHKGKMHHTHSNHNNKKWRSRSNDAATSRTPSPSSQAAAAVARSTGGSGGDSRGRGTTRHHRRHQQQQQQKGETNGDGGVSRPSHGRRSGDRDRRSSSHSKHHDKPEREPEYPHDETKKSGWGDAVASTEVWRRGRGPVVAPAFDVYNTTATPLLPTQTQTQAHDLTVQHLEEQKQLLQQQEKQLQLQEQPQNTHKWSAQNELSAVAGGRFGGADTRAPPPRATSPSSRLRRRSSMGPAGSTRSGLNLSQSAAQGRSNVADSENGGGEEEEEEEKAVVDLSVPVLSAHKRSSAMWRRTSAIHSSDSGPPQPAAWGPSTQQRGPGDGLTTSSPSHRYDGCEGVDGDDSAEEPRRNNNSNDRVDGCARRCSNGSNVNMSVPPSTTQSADPLAHSSHRFGLPTWTVGGSSHVRQAPAVLAGGNAARFSASPQLASTSPIVNSYVAQSFSSYLPGHSTVLGGCAGATAAAQKRAQAKTATANSSGNVKESRHAEAVGMVGVEVAVLARQVEELPSPDVLTEYGTLFKRYTTAQQQPQQRRGGSRYGESDSNSTDIAALFSLVVHISLPQPAALAATGEDGVATAEQPVVTIGDVKDEVALRTGIPSAQQCLVYEAMSLQDSLPVHLLLSAGDDDEGEGVEEGGFVEHPLRLLCVPLKAATAAELGWPSPKRRVHPTAADAAVVARENAVEASGLLKGSPAADDDGVDDLQSLLLLSPARHGLSTAPTGQDYQPDPQQEQTTSLLLDDNVEVAPPVRRGAVPFTLSHTPVARLKSATANSHGSPAVQRPFVSNAEQEVVARHIDRLRRLYLEAEDDRVTSCGGAPPGNASLSSALPPPRDYLLQPDYKLRRTGRVEHADPVVRALQQTLLLRQLTAPSSVDNGHNHPGVDRAARTAPRGNSACAAARLSDALIAALPAPPVRQTGTQLNTNSGANSNSAIDEEWSRGRVATPKSAVASARQAPPLPNAAAPATPSRFAAKPLLSTRSSVSAGAGSQGAADSHLSVLRQTPPLTNSTAFLSGKATSKGSNSRQIISDGRGMPDSDTETERSGGVDASWLESSHASSDVAALASARALEAATSQAPSTLGY